MASRLSNDVAVITQAGDLSACVARLRQTDWVAVDTEFLRERTYFPQLCLIQLASAQEIACVDPLALDDLSPLADLLTDNTVTKVFHAAFQDLEILYQACGVVPAPVFDTQVGAALLGHPDQIGYARLVEAMLGVQLEKSHARADWSRRPLSDEELSYAADDVRYLAQIYPQTLDALSARGRLAWLADEFEPLSEPARYENDPAQAWRRLKGLHKLKAEQQQVAARLAQWREQTAIAGDRPRGWILKDDVLQDVARRCPRKAEELKRIRGLPEKTLHKHGNALLDCVERGKQAPAEGLAADKPRLDTDQNALVDVLMAGLRIAAREADISPAALANRRDLEKLVTGARDVPVMKGWRHAAAGAALLELLSGERRLRVAEDGKPRLD